jgi:hypothetical protein
MQIVVLSTRPAVLAETVAHVAHFLPWVDRWLVVTPDRVASDIDAGPAGTVLSDEDLTGLTPDRLGQLDHTTRNFVIRGALATHDLVDAEFVMSDDDYRPIKPTGPDDFRRDGRDRAHYFYDLDSWPGVDTTFDEGVHNTRELMAYLGAERLAYGSHMPQLFRKDHWAEAFEIAERAMPDRPLCEWSVYFNIARHRHPDDFCDPEPFRTLCWPEYANEWPWWVRPSDYAFENFYPGLYRPGHLFDGIPTALDAERAERHNLEKIVRWAEFDRRAARLDFPDDVANPWTGTSSLRRASFGVLRRVQQAYRYISLDQRRQITELRGTVARLEEELRRSGERPGGEQAG